MHEVVELLDEDLDLVVGGLVVIASDINVAAISQHIVQVAAHSSRFDQTAAQVAEIAQSND